MMPLIGSTNEEKIWNYLKATGFSDCGAAGLMGNLYAESGLRPNNLQNIYEKKLGMTDTKYTELVDKGFYTNFVYDSVGYGLAQWTYWSRKQELLAHANSTRKSIGDLEMQLEFLLKELTGYGLLNKLKSATNVREASNITLLEFEKPASMNAMATRTKRSQYAQTYYDKYSTKGAVTKLNLKESLLTNNPCYTAGQKIIVKGLMLHSVGCPQPSAQVFIKNWNKINYSRACVHAFIDGNDGAIYQCLPWDHRGWHGGGSSNNTHIGVEMCEPACIKYTDGTTIVCSDISTAKTVVKRTYEAAVELFAMLCQKYGLDPLADGVIVSHKEGCVRGIASNHGDPEHLWTQLGMNYTMDTFRAAVAAATGKIVATKTTTEIAANTDFQTYKVRITVTNLNIRSGPGSNNTSKGYIKPGTYTIVDEAAGHGATKWGKLKSGAGWVSLDYCKKLS